MAIEAEAEGWREEPPGCRIVGGTPCREGATGWNGRLILIYSSVKSSTRTEPGKRTKMTKSSDADPKVMSFAWCWPETPDEELRVGHFDLLDSRSPSEGATLVLLSGLPERSEEGLITYGKCEVLCRASDAVSGALCEASTVPGRSYNAARSDYLSKVLAPYRDKMPGEDFDLMVNSVWQAALAEFAFEYLVDLANSQGS